MSKGTHEFPAARQGTGRLRLFVRLRDRVASIAADRRARIGAAAAFVLLIVSFSFLWYRSSRYIDARLAGEYGETRTGVFAAPMVLRPGQPLERGDLVTYFEQLGYGSGSSDDTAGLAGRFSVDGNTVVVEPLDPAVAASGDFPAVTVIFSGDAGIEEVRDTRTKKVLETCSLEPLLITSAYNTRDGRLDE